MRCNHEAQQAKKIRVHCATCNATGCNLTLTMILTFMRVMLKWFHITSPFMQGKTSSSPDQDKNQNKVVSFKRLNKWSSHH